MCVPLLVLVLPNWGFGSSQLHWQVILQLHLLVLTLTARPRENRQDSGVRPLRISHAFSTSTQDHHH